MKKLPQCEACKCERRLTHDGHPVGFHRLGCRDAEAQREKRMALDLEKESVR
jgi:hypothetical protein